MQHLILKSVVWWCLSGGGGVCGINMLKSAALRSACSVFGVIRAGGIYGHSCNVRTFGIVVLSGELMGNVTVCLIFIWFGQETLYLQLWVSVLSVGHRSARVAQAIDSLSVTIGVQTRICVVCANPCLCWKCCHLCGLTGIMTVIMKGRENVGFEGASLYYNCTEL